MIRIASRYYHDNATQQEIADELFISRSLVSKCLSDAREQGIVDIRINGEHLDDNEIETSLMIAYNLSEVICVQTTENPEGVKQMLGHAAAKYLTKKLDVNMAVGISSGSTLNHMVSSFESSMDYTDLSFVPLVGGIDSSFDDSQASLLCKAMAKKTNSTSYELHAPVFVDTKQARTVFMRQPYISEVIEKAKQVDIAFIGAGGTETKKRIFNSDDFKIRSKNIDKNIGDISYNFVDKEGRLIDNDWNKCLIALNIEDFKKIDNVVLVAGNAHKHQTILAALKTRSINTLITDNETAKFLLTEANKTVRQQR